MVDSTMTIDNNNFATNTIHQKLMFEFISGDWRKFFKTWDLSFPPVFKKTIDYKLMTLKLRVHFAILPIRVAQLHQHLQCVTDQSSKVNQIFENVIDKFSWQDDEREAEAEENTLATDSMKQLEEFLNSCDGQKLAKKLKGSYFMTLYALPYIVNPQEDQSIKKLFSLEWLTELTDDLDRFVRNYLKEEILISEQETVKYLRYTYKKAQSPRLQCFSMVNNSFPEAMNESKGQTNTYPRKIHSAAKNKEIQDWMAGHQYQVDSGKFCSKSTQTHVSSVASSDDLSPFGEQHEHAIPSLFAVTHNQSTMHADELVRTKAKLFKIYRHYKKLRYRFHQLHEDYQKMNDIAEKLTIALESSVKGQPVNFNSIMQSCLRIFPDRFNRDIQTDSEDTSLDLREDLANSIFVRKEKQEVVNSIAVPANLLDYEKIKFHLQHENVKTKLLLLQALRQKITLSDLKHRNETIAEYIGNDLLGIWKNVGESSESDLLPHILPPHLAVANDSLQQTTSRLLNALASLKAGRSYLTSNPMTLNAIIKYLDKCNDGGACIKGDPITLDMLLATLQKMSLRKVQRNYMVEANLVEWLIHHLNNGSFRTRMYRLEYACALLMNLSLQSSARFRASLIAPLFVSTMISLLSLDCVSILSYVNGALQNFLLNNGINQEAKKFHFAEILEYHRMKNVDEIRNHFSHTLKIHKRESDDYLSDDDEFSDEDDEIFDVLEKELDENDLVKADVDEFEGDQLLTLCYSVPAFFLESKNYFNEKTDGQSNTQIGDFAVGESKKTILKTVTARSAGEITLNDSKTKIAEKKSGTSVAGYSINFLPWNGSAREEDIFSARPKLKRTPPSSASTEVYGGETSGSCQNNMK